MKIRGGWLLALLSIASMGRAQQRTGASAIGNVLKMPDAGISFQVWQYNGNKVAQEHIIPVRGNADVFTGRLSVDQSQWTCTVAESPAAKDGGTDLKVSFRVESGRLQSAGVAVSLDFDKWSRDNYVLIPAAVYDGNRFRVVNSGYMAPYPTSDYYNKNASLLFSDCPRLSLERGKPSKIELLTGNASTPAMCFFSPALQRGFILLTEQRTRLGNSGLIVEENAAQNGARFIVSAPGVRERVAGFGSFSNSGDRGADWNPGDSITLRFRLYSFPAGDIPSLLEKFMAVRKALTGPNHPRNITPFSAITQFTARYEDTARWYEDPTGSFYRPSNNNQFSLGWTGGLLVTYPLLAIGDSLHRERVFKNIDLAVTKMQGRSGYFYGAYDHGKLLTDRDGIPHAAMVRKNSDVLFWMVKQFLLLKAQGHGDQVRPEWEQSAKRLAQALVQTWRKNGQFGQYVDPETGAIIIFNSAAGAIAPAALALAGRYFQEPVFTETARVSAKFYYEHYVTKLGLTGGCCGDILQDADSETAFGLLESMMALYYVTEDKQWLARAKVVAGLDATWTLSYDEAFPSRSTLGRLGAHMAGAVFASVQNKHAAPGICTSSGDDLFKLYRATGDVHYAELLRDIIHAHSEVMETPGRITTGAGAGTSMERIQPTDAEGKGSIGQVLHTSNTWTETNGMLMALEIPGIYVRTDQDALYVFDAVTVKTLRRDAAGRLLAVTNPTRFDARVSVFAENAQQAQRPLPYTAFLQWPKIEVRSGETKRIFIARNGVVSVK